MMNTVHVRTSGSAIASLVLGVLAWCVLPFIGAVIAVVLGHIARGEIRRAEPGTVEGDGLAIAGLILGWVQLAFVGGLVFLFVGGLGLLVAFGH
ncbi:MAG: DUF4190 domain-containing protein [Rhodanobacteraceae bacterium]